MAIKILPTQPDIYITQKEFEFWMDEYSRAYRMYSGPLPSFEEYIRSRKAQKENPDRATFDFWQKQ
jgi:hypothetical protein